MQAYVGRLKDADGAVFDEASNTYPFSFTLGAGKVIKAWEIGKDYLVPFCLFILV
jgi:FKBP-type peptidyl-prolyl cis-trans isomerase